MKISPEEELLLSRCLRYEPEAVASLAQTYGRPVYGFLRSALGRRAELTHSLIIEAFAEALAWSVPFNLQEPFLVTALRHLLQGLEKRLKNKDAGGLPGPLSPRLQMIFQILASLTWEERVLILLRDQMDLDYEEIGAILILDPASVRSRLKDARTHFRSQLERLMERREPK